MKKKYIKPEIKTIKIDTEPCMNITSQHKEGEYPVCDCDRKDVSTIDELLKNDKDGK